MAKADQRRIVFLKLPAQLPDDVKRFIGTIIINELIHAIQKREHIPMDKRHQYCLFVDEFQHFVSNQDFGTAITEARKYGVVSTFAHQERYGQLRDNVVTRLAAGFFTNVAAGYLFTTFVSPTPWSLTNNVAFCILSLYTAYVFEQLVENG